MIIWVASYPKSGNTWIRSVISAYYYTSNGEFNFDLLKNIHQYPSRLYIKPQVNKPGEVSKLWELSQKEIINSNKNIFLKTHNANLYLDKNKFTSKKSTLGAIYVVRDPRNVISSLKNHYNLKNYDEALKFMTSDRKYIWDTRYKSDFSTFQFLSSWSNHYKSWKNTTDFKVFFVKYEDLEKDIVNTLNKLLKFINNLKNDISEIDKKKLDACIKSTSFNLLKKKENQNGFPENVVDHQNKKIDFFHLGPKNNWEKLLSNKIKSKMSSILHEELKELKYIN